MPRQNKQGKKRVTRVSVEAERREEIDWDRYAWALLQYCRSVIESQGGAAP